MNASVTVAHSSAVSAPSDRAAFNLPIVKGPLAARKQAASAPKKRAGRVSFEKRVDVLADAAAKLRGRARFAVVGATL